MAGASPAMTQRGIDIMTNRIDYAKASPEGFKAFGGVYVYLQKSSLPKELIYLVYLRV